MFCLKYGVYLLFAALVPLKTKAFLTLRSRSFHIHDRPTAKINDSKSCGSIIQLDSMMSNVNENPNTDEDSVCPFSMKYPRYRVPVSSGKDKSDYSAKANIFAGIKMALDKVAMERKFASDVKTNSFFWVEPKIDLSEDSDRTAKGKVGVFASSIVWRKLAKMVDSRGLDRVVISIPNTSAVGLSQLADIINWYREQQEEGTLHGNVNVKASVDEEAIVPTIILTVIQRTGESKQKNDLSTEHVVSATKSWVKRVLVKLGICPFTKAVHKSGQGLGDMGIPVGNIAYHHSSAGADEIAHLMADTWDAIYDMIEAGPSGKQGISSILLSAPEYDEDFSLWAGPIFAMLEANVGAAKAEPLIGVVCFHPKYKSPNGQTWPGFGHMHSVPRLRKWLSSENGELSNELYDSEVAAGGSYQRRTPYATINVLRAEQLEAAEGRRSTAELYARNIKVLHEYGFEHLQKAIAEDKA